MPQDLNSIPGMHTIKGDDSQLLTDIGPKWKASLVCKGHRTHELKTLSESWGQVEAPRFLTPDQSPRTVSEYIHNAPRNVNIY